MGTRLWLLLLCLVAFASRAADEIPPIGQPYHEYEFRMPLSEEGYDFLFERLEKSLEKRPPRTDYYIDVLKIKGKKKGEFLNRRGPNLIKIRLKDKSYDGDEEFYYHASKRLARVTVKTKGIPVSYTHLKNYSKELTPDVAAPLRDLARKYLKAVHAHKPKAKKLRRDFEEMVANIMPDLPGAAEWLAPLMKKGKLVPIIINTKKRYRMKVTVEGFKLQLVMGRTVYETTPGVRTLMYELEFEPYDKITEDDAKKIARGLGIYLKDLGIEENHIRPEDGYNVCAYSCERMADLLCKKD